MSSEEKKKKSKIENREDYDQILEPTGFPNAFYKSRSVLPTITWME